jgi:hypothetical protein
MCDLRPRLLIGPIAFKGRIVAFPLLLGPGGPQGQCFGHNDVPAALRAIFVAAVEPVAPGLRGMVRRRVLVLGPQLGDDLGLAVGALREPSSDQVDEGAVLVVDSARRLARLDHELVVGLSGPGTRHRREKGFSSRVVVRSQNAILCCNLGYGLLQGTTEELRLGRILRESATLSSMLGCLLEGEG